MPKIIYPEDPDYEIYEGLYDKCEHCRALINFEALSDEDIIMQRGNMVEYCGFKVSAPDAVIGFICPECGGENRF
jgi:DNA-directed RNA polymerase subunit RPC12/RpoP